MTFKQLGVTLIELMIAIAIVGIFIALTASGFFDYNVNATIRGVAEEINLGLRQAKVEAVTRNAVVTFSQNNTGWTVSVAPVGNGNAVQLTQRASRSNESNITVTATSANISFNGQGMTTALPNNGNANFVYAITSGTCLSAGGTIRCLNVEVSPAGRIKVCDPSFPVNSTDPRAC